MVHVFAPSIGMDQIAQTIHPTRVIEILYVKAAALVPLQATV